MERSSDAVREDAKMERRTVGVTGMRFWEDSIEGLGDGARPLGRAVEEE